MKPTQRLSVLPLLATAGLFSGGGAHAGRPLQTEDAGVIEAGSCEVEGATLRASLFGVETRESALQLACGVSMRTQVAVVAAYARAAGEGARSVKFNGKTDLWQGGPRGTLSLAYTIGSTDEKEQAWRHAATEVSLVYSRVVARRYLVHANLGHTRDEILNSRSATWAVAVEHLGLGPLAPMAEVFGNDGSGSWWNFGLRYTLVPHKLFIDGSYGRHLTSSSHMMRTIGFKFAF